MGGVRSKTTKMNALLHAGEPCIVTMDLRRCFPSTTNEKVFRVFRERLGCVPRIASVLTRLTTVSGSVPEGATSSPYLVNLALLDAYDALEALAVALDLNFSMWVDDIAFSGKNAREVIAPAVVAIRRGGYTAHAGKKQVMSRSVPQEVTGLLVNSGLPTISPAKREAIRQRILELAKRGHPTVQELSSIAGRIAYVRLTCPGQARYMQRLADQLLSR